MKRSVIPVFFTILTVLLPLVSCEQTSLEKESPNETLVSLFNIYGLSSLSDITVTIDQDAAQPDPANVLPVTFTVVFGDAIDPATFTDTDIMQTGTATGITWAAPSTSDNITWTLEATAATGDGTIVPAIAAGAAQDLLGNSTFASTSADNSVTYDTTMPTVTINQDITQDDPTIDTPVLFTVVFSEDIDSATFTTADIVQGGTATGITWLLSSSDTITWDLMASSVTSSGTIIPSISASMVQDTAGNGNAASASTDNSVMFDNEAPVITTFANTGADPTTNQVVPLTAAADDGNGVGISGWMITTSATAPPAADPGWLGAAPSSYTLAAIPSVYTLYLWVKDSLDHVSSGASFTVEYQLPAYSMQVLRTGQTTCYDETGAVVACAGTGQDADWLKGLAWALPRFTDNGNGTITDNSTGLIWTTNMNLMDTAYSSLDTDGTPGDGMVYWQTALDFAAQLNTDTYASRTDWRLPNILELTSLMNYGTNDMPAWFTSFGFTDHGTFAMYWSSTTYRVTSTGTNAWTFNFTIGQKGNNSNKATAAEYALAVAGNSTILPQTGQTACWDSAGNPIACGGTGQDGDNQAGLALPGTRFTHNGDGTTTDNLTGLMWATDKNVMLTDYPSFDMDQTAGDGAVYWENALAFVDQLNTDNYAGYSDWRLPNTNELLSVFQHELTFAGITALGFTHGTVQTCWTSTTDEFNTGNAFLYNILYGNQGNWLKTGAANSDRFVWPVRGN